MSQIFVHFQPIILPNKRNLLINDFGVQKCTKLYQFAGPAKSDFDLFVHLYLWQFFYVSMIFILWIYENFHFSVQAVGQPGQYGQLILPPLVWQFIRRILHIKFYSKIALFCLSRISLEPAVWRWLWT